MAVRERAFRPLLLVGPLGCKLGGLPDRDIADMHGMHATSRCGSPGPIPERRAAIRR